MKKMICLVLALMVMVLFVPTSYAGEHGGKEHGGKERGGKEKETKEHGGKEHGGIAIPEPTDEDIKKTMGGHVIEESSKTGTFDILDPVTGEVRKLSLARIHERVGKTGDYYYSCADFKDTETGELLDLDIDVEDKDGELGVADVRIHKVNGKERYTYDENDNRVPVTD